MRFSARTWEDARTKKKMSGVCPSGDRRGEIPELPTFGFPQLGSGTRRAIFIPSDRGRHTVRHYCTRSPSHIRIIANGEEKQGFFCGKTDQLRKKKQNYASLSIYVRRPCPLATISRILEVRRRSRGRRKRSFDLVVSHAAGKKGEE